jgi:hypothetical protein
VGEKWKAENSAVWANEIQPTVQRKMLPPSSAYHLLPGSFLNPEDGGDMFL